jgi:hypothetical protein
MAGGILHVSQRRWRDDVRRHAGSAFYTEKIMTEKIMPAALINYSARRVLLNFPLLVLSLPRDRVMRMLINARAQSFPATIRETSCRRS